MILATAALAARQTPDASDPKKLWALVIGISNYAHAEPLRYAATDALAFSEFLKSPRGGGILADHVYTLWRIRRPGRAFWSHSRSCRTRFRPGTPYMFISPATATQNSALDTSFRATAT